MTTYSISLDDVDLALLPARAGGYNNFLRREHYEFQVLAREDEDSHHTSHPCHICAIDVPTAFWSEHRACAKHRANARIATTAAQRTSALITASPPPPLQASGKFCDSCTIIAGKDHEKTKEHRISVIHDRMLCDLAKIYTGDADDDDDVEKMAKGDMTNGHVKNDNKEIQLDVKETRVDDGNMPKTELNAVDNTQSETARVLEGTIRTKAELPKDNAKGTHSNKMDNETYIKLLNSENFPKIQIQTSGNGIQILIDNEKINVLYDDFHSYHRLGSKIQCSACACTINATDEETHRLSMMHVKRIMQVVEDSHCIRQIYTSWSHCILCNQVINNKTINSHKLSMFHCDRKAACTVPEGPTAEDVKNVTTSSTAGTNQSVLNEIQNGGTETKNAGVEAKNAGAEAKNAGVVAKYTAVQNNAGGPSNFNARNQNGHVNKSNNTTVHKSKEGSKIEYPYKATEFPSSVYCVLCKCHVPNKSSNRSGHLTGARHAYSMKNNQQ